MEDIGSKKTAALLGSQIDRAIKSIQIAFKDGNVFVSLGGHAIGISLHLNNNAAALRALLNA